MRIKIVNKLIIETIKKILFVVITLFSFDSFAQINNDIQFVKTEEIQIKDNKAYLISSNKLFTGIAFDNKKGFKITYQNGEKVMFETFDSDKRRKTIFRYKNGKLDGKSAKQIFEKNTLKVNYDYKNGTIIDSVVHRFNPSFQELYIHTNISPNKHLFRKQLDTIKTIFLCVYENNGGHVSVSKNIKIVRFFWSFGCQGLDLDVQEKTCYFDNFRYKLFRENLDCIGISVEDIILEDEFGNQWIDNGFGIKFE